MCVPSKFLSSKINYSFLNKLSVVDDACLTNERERSLLVGGGILKWHSTVQLFTIEVILFISL